MNERSGFRIVATALFAVVIAAFIAYGAYNLGVQHGALTSGKIVMAQPAAVPPYAYYGWHPYGFGFFPFFGLFALIVFFCMLRAAFWRAHWHHHHRHACCAPEQKSE